MSNMKDLKMTIEEEFPNTSEEVLETLSKYFDGELLWGELSKELQDIIINARGGGSRGV